MQDFVAPVVNELIAEPSSSSSPTTPSAVADFVKNVFGRFRLLCDDEPRIMAVAVFVKVEMPDTVVESTPRHSSASNGWTIGEQLRNSST